MSEATPAPVEFSASELFFSTTDSRGVIEKANEVFVRLSGYEWGQLVGAPHNIIRHDDMPGGAFKLMWQTLQDGRPFCAYVVNRSASGAPYTVFATITPLGDGYLSVRSRPCADEFSRTAFDLYRPTRELERGRLASGVSGPAAATAGLEKLAGLLTAAGLPSYDAFIHQVLPAEVTARAAQAGPREAREGSGPLFELLGRVDAIGGQLAGWLVQMEDLAQLTASLQHGAGELRQAMEASARTAAQVTEAAGDGAAPIMLAVNVWASMMPEIEQALDALLRQLAQLAESSAETRFHIALAQLHDDATAQFVVELIDARGADATGSGVAAITDLAQALSEGLARTAGQARRNAELAQQVADGIESVRELMLVPQGLLGTWQEMVGDREDDQVAALMPIMAKQVSDGDQSAQLLAGLAERCRAQAAPLDVSGLEQEVAELRRLAGQVSGQQTAAAPGRGALLVEDDEPAFEAPARPRRGI